MFYTIQLLLLSEGNMMICSPEADNIARGLCQRAVLPVEGEHKGNNYFIMPINIFQCQQKQQP